MSQLSTDMQAGEEIVFGPVTSTKTTSVSGGGGASQGSLSRTVGRTVAVTDQRIVIEDTQDPTKSTTVPNHEVQKVTIKRKKRGEQVTITIAKVETATGSTVKVDLPGIDARREAQIGEVFPNAEVAEAKGLPTAAIIAIIVVGLLAVCCAAVTFGPLIAALFAK